MSEKIPLAIVGCGGMGHRHLFGLAELHNAGLSPFELIAAVDPVTANAESLADEAEARLGRRPTVLPNMDTLSALGVAAVDIPTTPPYHHSLAVQALEQGIHAMIEKPVGLTVRACNAIKNALAGKDLVVSVAENYRRDPVNRLAKSLIDSGVIGDLRFMLHHAGGGGNLMTITVWRHQKNQSGVLLDVGVHFADIMEYFMGPAVSVYAQTRLHELTRYNPAAGGGESKSNPAGVYGKWQKDMPAEFEATADDAVYGVVNFANGATASYVEEHAAHGQGFWNRRIHGSKGSMTMPNDRSGNHVVLHLDGLDPIDDGTILDLAPDDFHLDEATAALFGGDRLWKYDLEFAQTDRKLIAVEYADFGGAILGNHPVDVDLEQGTRSVALTYAMLESSIAGRVVTMEEMLAEEIDAYQRDIDEGLGLI